MIDVSPSDIHEGAPTISQMQASLQGGSFDEGRPNLWSAPATARMAQDGSRRRCGHCTNRSHARTGRRGTSVDESQLKSCFCAA